MQTAGVPRYLASGEPVQVNTSAACEGERAWESRSQFRGPRTGQGLRARALPSNRERKRGGLCQEYLQHSVRRWQTH